jgi:hypothetical protein
MKVRNPEVPQVILDEDLVDDTHLPPPQERTVRASSPSAADVSAENTSMRLSSSA